VELKMTTVRAVRQMLDYIYNPCIYSYKVKTEEGWANEGPVQMFQISYLAEKFNLPGLTKQVQASTVMVTMMQCFLKLLPLQVEKRLLFFPLHEDSILDAAATAEEFLTLFPGAAGALLTNCTSALATVLKTPADFAHYAAQVLVLSFAELTFSPYSHCSFNLGTLGCLPGPVKG
jgi:hypothetical protein